MNKIIFIFIVLFATLGIKAEVVNTFLDDSNIWCYCKNSFHAQNPYLRETRQFDYYFVDGSKVIGEHTYKLVKWINLYESTQEIKVQEEYPLREEDGVIYFPYSERTKLATIATITDYEKTADGTEFIIYDFNRQANSSFLFRGVSIIVDRLESVQLLDGSSTTIQQYKANGVGTDKDLCSIINGIGSMKGLYGYMMPTLITPLHSSVFSSEMASNNVIMYFMRNNEMLYKAQPLPEGIDTEHLTTSDLDVANIATECYKECELNGKVLEFIQNERAGVESVKVDATETDSKQEGIFDVNGVRLSEPPVSGFYIENGEKKLAK